MLTEYQNPFYRNYLFSSNDLKRAKIHWWAFPLLWFRTTYVQIADGHAFHFKVGGRGEIYLMKVEPLPPNSVLDRNLSNKTDD